MRHLYCVQRLCREAVAAAAGGRAAPAARYDSSCARTCTLRELHDVQG